MRKFGYLLLALPLGAIAQGPLPVINADGIIRADTNRSGQLPPGMTFSIYGHGFGPQAGCKGAALELCGVQVLLDDSPIEVQYAQENQINARVPATAPSQTVSRLIVVSGGSQSAPVEVRRGPDTATISLDGVARVDGPVWIHVDLPNNLGVSYPTMAWPWDFACNEFEVRKDGKLLPALPHSSPGGMTYSGPSCPGTVVRDPDGRKSRLPLHLQYRFDQPGVYEVRLSHYEEFYRHGDVRMQSVWTPIEVLPAVVRTVATHPQDPAEILSGFLPDLLALRDDEALSAILEYLYHPNQRVRAYAANALYYWPDSVVEARLAETTRADGPAPMLPAWFVPHDPELLETALSYLSSDNPVLFAGAIAAARTALSPNANLNPELRARLEQCLIGGAGNLNHADAQTINDFIAVLGEFKSPRVHDLLWSLANSRTGTEQALIAIAWQKDPTDLPRLTDWLTGAPVNTEPPEAFSGIPYQMRAQFGDAAQPWLRTVLEKSPSADVRINCAEELMPLNDPSAFAFLQDAFEQTPRWKSRIRVMVNDQFPETKNKSDSEIAGFLRARAKR